MLRKATIEKWKRNLYSIVYPPRCPVCNELVNPAGPGIHKACREKIFPAEEPVCLKCGKPLPGERMEYCWECSRLPRVFTQGKALFIYRGQMKGCMYRFKYSNCRDYADYFAREAASRYGDWIRQRKVEAIAPIPMFPGKEKTRGYNQADVFGRRLAEEVGVPYEKKLTLRIKNTRPMKELGDLDRKKNLKNAFQYGENAVKYKRVLLVDDIFTTGATVDAVSLCLRAAGCQEIYFLCVCIGKS